MSTHDFNFPWDLAASIRMLVLDVDGVLTDGSIFLDNHNAEIKAFNVRDGHGIKLLQRADIEVAILTGRNSPIVARRAAELGITRIIQGSKRKNEGIMQLLDGSGINVNECAYMGDDIVDFPAMRLCRLSMAPADAHAAVKAQVNWVSGCAGGHGAVRQAAEALILANKKWQQILAIPYGISIGDAGWLNVPPHLLTSA
ncbi:MAG: HAD-IIIA family hydrolase [Mariprofundales bacterium]